ncbi:hypothetical protein CR513_25815, partial [Mucuna pruriens]
METLDFGLHNQQCHDALIETNDTLSEGYDGDALVETNDNVVEVPSRLYGEKKPNIQLHDKARLHMEKKGEQYARSANREGKRFSLKKETLFGYIGGKIDSSI